MNFKTESACKKLTLGELVCFPTETVYALAANATSLDAINNIYNLKGRQKNHPLAVMAPSVEIASSLVKFNSNSLKIAECFLPGPLTIILPKCDNSEIAKNINPQLKTLAIRIPDHPIALEILNNLNSPIVATSVNPSGKPPAATKEEILNYFPNQISEIVDGHCDHAIASTIIDMSCEEPKLLRQGGIELAEILQAISS